jgi:8-oxo-dGTP pyrophosphatase MutT (NUDIX family)
VLLARRASHKKFPGLWGVPGGKVEIADLLDETDVIVGAGCREVSEEVGLGVKDIQYMYSEAAQVSPGTWHLFVFFSAAMSHGPAVAHDDTDEVRWVDPREMSSYDLLPGMKRALSTGVRLRA